MSRSSLPVDEVLPQLRCALDAHSVALLVAPTGAGKTTRVAPDLLQRLRQQGRDETVLLVEPRRLAARAAARRMAFESATRVGAEVGYHVRFDRKVGGATRIVVVTEGMLVRYLQRDPFLEEVTPRRVGSIVFDEFHERHIDGDLALAMVRRVREEARDDLEVVVMSATLDIEPLRNYWQDSEVVQSEGRLFPVEKCYLPQLDDRAIDQVMAEAVKRGFEQCQQSLLAFLPGVGEIERTRRRLDSWSKRVGVTLHTLHGSLPPEKQDRALQAGSGRRVVLATNVAESSVTVEGIDAVVDSGWAKVLRYDDAVAIDRLELRRISRSSAEQRAGRAGRTSPGVCFRLWTEREQDQLDPTTAAEITRVDVAGVVLQLLAWGEIDLQAFPWFEAPSERALSAAFEQLRRLGALDSSGSDAVGASTGASLGESLGESSSDEGSADSPDGESSTPHVHRADSHRITELGREMAEVPTAPRIARLLLAGKDARLIETCASLAAYLSERDPLPPDARTGDLLQRIRALEECEQRPLPGLHVSAFASFRRLRRQFLDQMVRKEDGDQFDFESSEMSTRRRHTASVDNVGGALRQALALSFPDRLVRRRDNDPTRGVMVGGRGVRLPAGDSTWSLGIILDGTPRGKFGEATIQAHVDVEEAHLPQQLVTRECVVFFDESSESVRARNVRRFLDLTLEQSPAPLPTGTEVEQVLQRAAAQRLDRALPFDKPEVQAWVCRLRFLAHWCPELGLPAASEDELREILPYLCRRRRSFADLRKAPLLEQLRAQLSYDQQQLVDRHAPESITLPRGGRRRLRYGEGEVPILAAKIQDLFGMQRTPTVANGKVKVLVHLLAPNQRPQQVTDDLASFWENTYPVVRKELRGRYPKHAWPEDPRQ